MTPEEWQAFLNGHADEAALAAARLMLGGDYSEWRAAEIITRGQAEAVGPAGEYVQGFSDTEPEWDVHDRLLVGVASDGRTLEGLMTVPLVNLARRMDRGASYPQARLLSSVDAGRLASTMVYDAGRVATSMHMAIDFEIKGYRRALMGEKNCARCIILAGKFYRWNAGFQRHPQCDCVHVPIKSFTNEQALPDPYQEFAALSKAEQERTFTKEGAAAIRDGADIFQVVNARRGMRSTVSYSDKGKSTFRTTSEGATRRRNGRDLANLRGPRLMPEQIYRKARSRDEAVRLLADNGYISASPQRVALNPPGDRNGFVRNAA